MVIWLIGLSGAGKTTVGTRLAARLKADHPNVVYLDGDVLREVWGESLGHGVEDRETNAGRISRLCALLDREGTHVVAAVLSIFPEWQAWNRATFSDYFEVFLDVPMDVLLNRDSKGLYRSAQAGETRDVVGVDIPFPRPAHPDLVLPSWGEGNQPDALVDRILGSLPGLIRGAAPVLAAAAAYLLAEFGAWLLIRRFRPGFRWLVTPDDIAPEIPGELARRHAGRSFDPDLGWCRRAGEHGTEQTGAGETTFTLDAQGRRRNPGFEDAVAEVACFGDSFVFCRLVNDDQTWPHHLSRRLGVHVANYGVGNYGLDQALLRLERQIESLDARVVIMGVVPETIARVQSYWKHYFEYGNTLAFKPRFTLGPEGLRYHPSAIRHPSDYACYQARLPEIQRLDGFYRRKFRRDLLCFPYLPRLARRWRRHLPVLGHLALGALRRDPEAAFQLAFQAVMRDNARLAARLYADPEALRLLRALVERFATTCHAAGKEPLLLVIPQLVDLEHDGAGYQAAFAALRDVVPVVDVTPQFRRSADPGRLFSYGRLGPHPGDRGNALIADALEPRVTSLLGGQLTNERGRIQRAEQADHQQR